jgi:Putative Flp pilus-assembly TadE/G-like
MYFTSVMRFARPGNERGQILIWTTLMSGVLILFMGIAMDAGYDYQYQRYMQTGADSAARAGYAEKLNGGTTSEITTAGRNNAAKNGFTHGTKNIDVAINTPPTQGNFSGQPGYVEAIITRPTPTFFMPILNLVGVSGNYSTTTVRAHAVAGKGQTDCIYALHQNASEAFRVWFSTTLNAGCGIQVNSSASDAMKLDGSHVNATNIDVTGDYQAVSGSSVSPDPNSGAAREPDPLAWLPPPTVGSCGARPNGSSETWEIQSNMTINPGVYCGGIKIGAGATVTLNPGLYVMKGGGLTVEGTSTIASASGGVTIYNTGPSAGAILLQSGSIAKLSAPSTGTYAGILFFQDRSLPFLDNSLTAHIQSTTSSFFNGSLYFPSHELDYRSGSTSSGQSTVVVAQKINMQSGSTININVDITSLPSSLATAIIRPSLVE